MEKKRLQEISHQIAESDFFKKYGYKHYWTSGCVTEVAPITLWIDAVPARIEIQLGCKTLRGIKNSLDKLVREIGKDSVRKYYLTKNDGSCPPEARIIFN